MHTLRIVPALVLSLVLAAGFGCKSAPTARRDWKAAAAAPALEVSKARIRGGETLIWTFRFRGMEVGELVMAAGEPGESNGRQVVIVRSRMQTTGLASLIAGVDDEFTTLVDVETAQPLQQTATVSEDEWREIEFDRGGLSVTYASPDGRKTVRQQMPRNAFAFDLNSLLFAMRSWSETDSAVFHVLGTTHLWRSRAEMGVREEIRTPFGTREAIRIDGYAERVTRDYQPDEDKQPRRYSLWYSADPDRLPLRMVAHTDYGDMQLDLTEYRWGDRVLSAR